MKAGRVVNDPIDAYAGKARSFGIFVDFLDR